MKRKTSFIEAKFDVELSPKNMRIVSLPMQMENTKDTQCDLCKFAWIDQDKRRFIESGSLISLGRTMISKRLSQLDDTSKNNDPIYVGIKVRCPKAVDKHYKFLIRLIRKMFH